MFLLRKKEFNVAFVNSLDYGYKPFNWLSFFYGNLNIIDSYKNEDFEFKLYRKISTNPIDFTEEERNALYFYASMIRLILLKKNKNISLPSYFLLQNYKNLDYIKEKWKKIYLHPLYKAKINGQINSNFVLSEMANFLAEELVSIKNIELSDSVDSFYEVSARSKMFVKNHFNYVKREHLLKHKFFSESLSDKQKMYGLKEANIDDITNSFTYLNNEILLLCISHLNEDNMFFISNGQIILKEKFLYEYKAMVSQESKEFNKQILDLHTSFVEKSHTLHRCDDSDVYKIFKKACHGKV